MSVLRPEPSWSVMCRPARAPRAVGGPRIIREGVSGSIPTTRPEGHEDLRAVIGDVNQGLRQRVRAVVA